MFRHILFHFRYLMKLFKHHNKGFWHEALEGRCKATKKCNESNAEVVEKAFFFSCTAVRVHPLRRQQTAHSHLSSAARTEQKHQMYTSIQPYILFALTAFQQLLVPMQMSRLSPTPNRGEVIWAAEYKWLGMIDRPSHSPPSADR